jgi:hypothetical protein
MHFQILFFIEYVFTNQNKGLKIIDLKKKQIYFEFSILGNNFDESKEKYPLIVLHERFLGAVTLVRTVEALVQFYPADGVRFLVVHRHDDLVHEYGVGLFFKFAHTPLGLARNEGKKQALFEFEND